MADTLRERKGDGRASPGGSRAAGKRESSGVRGWVVTWMRTLFGAAPKPDPWNDDPKIREEREGQHQRMNRATAYSAEDQMLLRERRLRTIEDIWRRQAPDG